MSAYQAIVVAILLAMMLMMLVTVFLALAAYGTLTAILKNTNAFVEAWASAITQARAQAAMLDRLRQEAKTVAAQDPRWAAPGPERAQ